MLTAIEHCTDVYKILGFDHVYLAKCVYGGANKELAGKEYFQFYWQSDNREVVVNSQFHEFGASFRGFLSLSVNSDSNWCKGHFNSIEDALDATSDEDIVKEINKHIHGLSYN